MIFNTAVQLDGTVKIFDIRPINHYVDDTKLKAKLLHRYNNNRGFAPIVICVVVQNHNQF